MKGAAEAKRVLVLRPAPGDAGTVARAEAISFVATAAPLFAITPVAWVPSDDAHDALMLTSANALRHAGEALTRHHRLPAYTVGAATAAAARDAGFADIRVGTSDAAALLAQMAADGIGRPLHLAGREHRDAGHPGLTITRRIVYATDPVGELPEAARTALADGAIALLHSPRAAVLFASLITDPSTIRIAAISRATAQAAGQGWAAVAIAASPTDQALLQAANELP